MNASLREEVTPLQEVDVTYLQGPEATHAATKLD